MRFVAGFALCTFWSAALPAQGPNAADLTTQLGHADYAVREAAHAQLFQADPAVLPLLEVLLRTETSVEGRTRLTAVIAELKRRGERERTLKADLVTLRLEAMPLKRAVAEVRRSAHIDAVLHDGVPDQNRLVSLTVGPVPVWEAVERFRLTAGLEESFPVDPPAVPPAAGNPFGNARNFQQFSQTNVVSEPTPILWTAGAAQPSTLSADRAGLVRVSALPARFPLNHRLGGVGISLIHLDVAMPQDFNWSPTNDLRITRAEDETGRSVTTAVLPSDPAPDPFERLNILLLNNGGMMMNPNRNTSRYGGLSAKTVNPRFVAVPIRTDDRFIGMLRVLEGTIAGELTLPNEAILTIADLPAAAGKVHELGPETTLSILDVSTTPEGGRTIKVRITAPNPWNLARRGVPRRGRPLSIWEDGGIGSSALKSYRFTDDRDHAVTGLVHASTSTDNGVQQTSELEIRFNKKPIAGVPHKLVVLGDRIVPLAVPFRLVNVPMP